MNYLENIIPVKYLQTADEINRNGRYYAEDLNILFGEEKEKDTNENSNSEN